MAYKFGASGEKILAALLLLTFLVYSSVSSVVFQTFACETLDDDVKYLRADYRIQCTDDTHKVYVVYAVFMVAIYPVGIPFLYSVFLLVKYRGNLVVGGNRAGAQPIAGLWEPYPDCFFYEIIECGRRVALTIVAVFMFPGDAAQIAMIIVISLLFYVVFEILSPYGRSPRTCLTRGGKPDTWLSRGGHSIVFLSMFDILLRKLDVSGERDESQDAYGGALVACNVLMVLVIFGQICCQWCQDTTSTPAPSPAVAN